MTTIRVGGVPEHFNLPWHLAIESDQFSTKNVHVEWKTFNGGTGAMCKALRDDEVDLCVILTEGITRDIINGSPSKIISKYINTPLIWGVHTGAENQLEYYGQIFNRKFAISRRGSGSHLMPMVDAMIKGEEIENEQLVVINNLDGALESLKKNETDVFYWEKYTTKPFVDAGILKSLGEFVTPWPCFVLAATDKILSKHHELVKSLVETIQFVSHQFVNMPDAIELLSQRYELEKEDVENWFHSTEWATDTVISDKMMKNVVHSLKKAELIDSGYSYQRDHFINKI